MKALVPGSVGCVRLALMLTGGPAAGAHFKEFEILAAVP
jgi:hypothetical protein